MQEIILKFELIRMESIIGIVNEGDSLSHCMSISLYPVNLIVEQSREKEARRVVPNIMLSHSIRDIDRLLIISV